MLIHVGTSDLVLRRNLGADAAPVPTPATTQNLVWDWQSEEADILGDVVGSGAHYGFRGLRTR